MRDARILPLLLLSAACGDDPAVIDGFLARDAEATHVWVLGHPERAAVSADSFRIEGVEGGLLDLRFASGDEEVARMEIRGLAAGERLRLRDIWFDDGIAYPSGVEREGSGAISVNGLRMGGAEAVAGAVDVVATILAVSREGDALLARPTREGMPDLRVVVTPGTRVRTPDGDPAAADELEFGDTVQVVGEGESGFVIATELVLPRERAGAAARQPAEEDEESPRFVASPARSGSGAAAPRGVESGRREPAREERGRGRGREKAKEKGKGKG